MKRSSHFKRLAATALTVACLQGGALASQVVLSSEFNDLLFDSNGNTLDTTFSFEIGTFGGFIPTYQNIDQWAANWHVFERAYDPDANGWNAVDQFFVAQADHNTSGNSESPDANPLDVFIQGEKIYLWVYNSKDILPTSEWALVTDSVISGNTAEQWVIPDPMDLPPISHEMKLVDADDVIIGGVNGVQGEGTFNATPPAFSLQTAVVPEPGSGLLVLAAAAAFLQRRGSRRLVRSTQA